MSTATAAHRLLQWLPPELAHRLAVRGMRTGRCAPGPKPWVPSPTVTGCGFLRHVFPNPLGLAAGFDKPGRLVDAAPRYGFGWVEVGSVTWCAHPGNAGTRLFRVGPWDIQNRMGLNSPGAEVVREHLQRAQSPHYGINIAKSNKPGLGGEHGIADILRTVECLSGFGVYHVLNLSCPNTHEAGTTFEDPAVLRELLPGVRVRLAQPWGVKLSPHRDRKVMDATVAVCEAEGCHFYVMGNTLPTDRRGGRSGRWLLPLTLPRVRWLCKATQKPVIGCGGIFQGEQAYLYEQAGAVAVQAFNGFVRGPASGPGFAHTVLDEWAALRSTTFKDRR